ncbi:MAG: hypothetical protein AB7H97_06840, partial [Pseudobdellovibrionaceae bacterium]
VPQPGSAKRIAELDFEVQRNPKFYFKSEIYLLETTSWHFPKKTPEVSLGGPAPPLAEIRDAFKMSYKLPFRAGSKADGGFRCKSKR